jgi:hypothetical protein
MIPENKNFEKKTEIICTRCEASTGENEKPLPSSAGSRGKGYLAEEFQERQDKEKINGGQRGCKRKMGLFSVFSLSHSAQKNAIFPSHTQRRKSKWFSGTGRAVR